MLQPILITERFHLASFLAEEEGDGIKINVQVLGPLEWPRSGPKLTFYIKREDRDKQLFLWVENSILRWGFENSRTILDPLQGLAIITLF